jgi:biopolymer transport protein ExbD
MAKKKASKQKKMDTRVNFTPMVDMMMLLITFFMLCTTLSKPQAMQLVMPSNDQNMTEEDKSVAKASYTITLYLGENDKIYYVEGLPEYENPDCLKETTWGKDGVRKLLIEHVTEAGFSPVAAVLQAKRKLDEKKAQMGDRLSKEAYDKELSEIRNGKHPDLAPHFDPGKNEMQTLTVVIKPMDVSNYNNMVQALDEMLVCAIGKYVIDKITENDMKLLDLKGIKYSNEQ